MDSQLEADMSLRSMTAASVLSGAAIAVAAAQLFVITGATALAADANQAKIHCAGVNACKGKSECSSAKNGCKGQNECNGQVGCP